MTPPPAPPPVAARVRKRFRLTRDGMLFGVGILGIAYETLVTGGDRPTLLVLFGAMVGLPAFLRGDEKTKDKVGGEPLPSVLGVALGGESTATPTPPPAEPPKEAP